MRRPATLILVAAVAAVLAAPQAHAGFKTPRSCRSGEGIFREGPVRLFRIEGTIAGEQAWRHYVCSARLRRPRQFNETSPGTDEQLSTFRRSGRRVAFVSTLSGGESFEQVLGWVDLHTGRSRFTNVSDEDEGPIVLAVVADTRGGIAYLQDEFDDGAQRIGYARLWRNGELGAPRARALVTDGPVLRRSLAVSGGMIRWTTRSGETGSVATGS